MKNILLKQQILIFTFLFFILWQKPTDIYFRHIWSTFLSEHRLPLSHVLNSIILSEELVLELLEAITEHICFHFIMWERVNFYAITISWRSIHEKIHSTYTIAVSWRLYETTDKTNKNIHTQDKIKIIYILQSSQGQIRQVPEQIEEIRKCVK